MYSETVRGQRKESETGNVFSLMGLSRVSKALSTRHVITKLVFTVRSRLYIVVWDGAEGLGEGACGMWHVSLLKAAG